MYRIHIYFSYRLLLLALKDLELHVYTLVYRLIMSLLIIEQFEPKIDISLSDAKNVKKILVDEYINEFQCQPIFCALQHFLVRRSIEPEKFTRPTVYWGLQLIRHKACIIH